MPRSEVDLRAGTRVDTLIDVHLFDVWAPAASTVDLVLSGDDVDGPAGCERRLPMIARPGGWWTLEVPGAGHGTDYAFSLDAGPARPDPRSPWQPGGVHTASRVFDTSRFRWTDTAWSGRDIRGSVIYELHVGTFTPEGTLDAAALRLGHLVGLGVDVVELMPVAAFDGRWGWGYDGVALYAVHEPYGGPAALQRFVDAAHGVGLAVCLDVVYNHLGPSGNYLEEFGPYFTDQHETPWGAAVNLDDDGRLQVRRWVCDNALRWLQDFHVDALRLDAVHCLVDESRWHLLAQLSDEVAALSAQLRRPLSLVAESDLNDPGMVEPTAEGGMGMTAQWSDDFHHALHAALTGERQGYYVDFGSLGTLARTLTRVFRHAGDRSTFRGGVWGHPVDRRPAPWTPVRRLPAEPRPGRQPGLRRPDRGHARPRPAGDRGRAGADLAVHPDAVHGRGVGREHCRGSSSPTTPTPRWRRRFRRAAAGVRRARLGRRRRPAIRRTRRPGGRRARLGGNQTNRNTRAAGLVPRPDRPAPDRTRTARR